MAKMSERQLKKYLKPLSVALRDQAKNFYMAVGLGISSWSKMEERLVQVVARLLRTPEAKAGLIMYSIMNLHVWVQIIDDLFVQDGTYPKSLKLWRSIAESLRAENNIRVGLGSFFNISGRCGPRGRVEVYTSLLAPRKVRHSQ
jgi:hypothetical protein